MNQVEIHNISKQHKDYKELDNLCFLSKNLYNSTLYAVRQYYFSTGEYLSYNQVNKIFTDENQADYRALPAKVAKGTQRLVEQDFKSFFALLRKVNNGTYNKKVHIPRYADKIHGRKKVHYEKGALSFKKKGYIHLSKTNVFIKTKINREDIDYVDIIPCKGYVRILVGYTKKCKEYKFNKRFASIDLGVNNLATVSSNVISPFIINGKPLKSINQFYNKQLAKSKSLLPKGVYTSKNIHNILCKRDNKINNYLHKASRYIVNQLVSNNITVLVIGYNKEWKQDTKLGKVNNQNFLYIPFYRFIQMIEYKCRLAGIAVYYQEESYTSKCSFLDNESIEKHKEYLGKRIHRGLFRTSTNKYINADLNASLNILKKLLVTKVVWNNQFWLDQIEASSMPNINKLSFI